MDSQVQQALGPLKSLNIKEQQQRVNELRQELHVQEGLLALLQALAVYPDEQLGIPERRRMGRPPKVREEEPIRLPRVPDALPSGVVRTHKDVLPAQPKLVGSPPNGSRPLSQLLDTLVEEFTEAPERTPESRPIEVPPRPELEHHLKGSGKFQPEYRPSVDPLDPPERPASMALPPVILPPVTDEDLQHARIKQFSFPSEIALDRVKLPEKKSPGRGLSLGGQRRIKQMVLYLAHVGVSKVRSICDTLGCQPDWTYKTLAAYPQLFCQAKLGRGWQLTEAVKQQLAESE